MFLETESGIKLKDVTETQLREVFQKDFGEYIFLSRNNPEHEDQHWIQAGYENGFWDLEYKDAEDDPVFHAAGGEYKYTAEQVGQAFLSYLRKDNRWRTDFPWVKIEDKKQPWWKFW
jgi:hypothetical protein